MQAEEGRGPYLRKPTREEYRILNTFALSQGIELEAMAHNPMVLEVAGDRYNDVFDIPIPVARLLGKTRSLYSAGYYIGYIEDSTFNPGIPLSHRLSRLCGLAIQCIRLGSGGERHFLYGKIVYGENILEWYPGLRVVVNEWMEALGWGVGVRRRNRLIVEPFKDLGWYLRRGG